MSAFALSIGGESLISYLPGRSGHPAIALFQSHVVPLERMPDVGLWLSACRLREHGGNNGFFQAQGGARAAKSTQAGRPGLPVSIPKAAAFQARCFPNTEPLSIPAFARTR